MIIWIITAEFHVPWARENNNVLYEEKMISLKNSHCIKVKFVVFLFIKVFNFIQLIYRLWYIMKEIGGIYLIQ